VDDKGNPQDGFLDLRDIYNLDLAADLVVLSACETALGKEVDGEGMIGLTRGFMYAGAGGVVGARWKVDDSATAQFMKTFYSAIEKDGLSAAQALRRAQLALRKEKRWSFPFYWSGFMLQGDWK
jgi:CHAT domain-containing protein